MYLAHVIKHHQDELLCDLAEFYGVHHYRDLPVDYVAVLTFGLDDRSRVRKAMGGEVSQDTLLLCGIFDRLSDLLWTKTKDAQKGRNRPKKLVDTIFRGQGEDSGFASAKEYMRARAKMLKGGE